MIILPSFFTEGSVLQSVLAFSLRSLVVFAGIYAIHETNMQLYAGLIIGTFVILINLFGVFKDSVEINYYLSFVIYIFFYCLIAYKLMNLIIRSEKVNLGVLYAAVNVYLLIGIIGGFIYMLIENSQPGSINNLSVDKLNSTTGFFYLSFITLSTLGYGDITPVSPSAKAVSIMLSTAGPLYLTILVALLVSRFEAEHH